MKYYVYISDSKVEMLLSQIEPDEKKKIATEKKLDLKVFSISRRTEADHQRDRIAKLEAVTTYIGRFGNIGTVDEPDEYFYGDLSMRWGPFESFEIDNPLVYFGGRTDRTIVGLGGSAKHVIGNEGSSSARSDSATPYIVSHISKELGLRKGEEFGVLRGKESAMMSLYAVQVATRDMGGPAERLEFIAKRLISGPSPYPDQDERPGMSVLLGTPLYVAMVE
jgi:hypothetical protein